MTFALASSTFADGTPIPTQHTCDGIDQPPALAWTGVPASAQSLALIVDDPDAPDPKAPKMVYVHWVLYNIPPGAHGLEEGVKPETLPSGTRQGKNDWKRTGYGGPCPPIGCHRYYFKLYALDTVLPDLREPTKDALLAAMEGHVIAETQLMGTYERGSTSGK